MPTIAMFDGIKIQVFADHNPPHFHAVKAEFEILISIGSWQILQGSMRRVISMRSWTGQSRTKRSFAMSGDVSMDNEILTKGRPLPRIAAATIIDNRRVRVTWRDGNSVTVDLAPVLNSHRHFIPLRTDEENFATMRVNDEGTALEWDGGIELSAVWIATLPAVGMENGEFRQIMDKLSYSLDGMALQLDVSRRLIAMYRGSTPIPNSIALATRYLAEKADER